MVVLRVVRLAAALHLRARVVRPPQAPVRAAHPLHQVLVPHRRVPAQAAARRPHPPRRAAPVVRAVPRVER